MKSPYVDSLAVEFEGLSKQQRAEQIVRYLKVLFPAEQVIEVRIPKVTIRNYTSSYRGYFDDFTLLAKAIAAFEGQAESIYCTINPVNSTLLARAYNKIVKAEKGSSTTDEDITRRVFIPIDFDPVRPAGISSTDIEHAAALLRAEQVREYLALEGWPEPIVGDSGNGAHLLYTVGLPNNLETLGLVEGVLKALDSLFSDAMVKVDTTSGNAARIWKVYGTLAAKGSDTADRPHRFAMLLSAPATPQIVPVELLKHLGSKAPNHAEEKPTHHRSSGKALDVESWLQKHGIGYTSKGPWHGGTIWNLSKCHFSTDHTDGAWVAQFPSGAIDAGCHHDRCKGKHWRELRELYDGKREPNSTTPENEWPEIDNDDVITAILTGTPVRGLPFDLYDFRAEDGGILDAWDSYYGDRWAFFIGPDDWADWTGTHWRQKQDAELRHSLEDLISNMNIAAEEKIEESFTLPKDEQKSAMQKAVAYCTATKRTAGRVNSVMTMAEARRYVDGGGINAGNLLNLRNGTLDLDTLRLKKHDPGDYLTYCLPFDFDEDAIAPLWTTKYLPGALVKEHSIETDVTLIALAQELFGYALTNDTRLEVMTWLWGDGGNGKTVMIEMLQALLGPLATNVDFQNIGLPGNYELASLVGKRVALSTESERGGTVAEGYVKRIASGEMITARPIYGAPFDYRSTAKIWWAMNEKPIIKSTSSSMWRRLKMIPFYHKFSDHEKDVHLRYKLMQELPGILNWAIEGLVRLRSNNYRFTQSVTAEAFLKEYEEESNPTQQWIKERTTTAAEPSTSVKALYDDYKAWCKSAGRQALNDTNFGKELKRLGIAKIHSRTGRKYALFLKPSDIDDNSSSDEVSEALGF